MLRSHALQLQRLRWTLQHAYDNVPHYKAAFDAQGVHPSDCRTLADLAGKLPAAEQAVLTKSVARPLFCNCASVNGGQALATRRNVSAASAVLNIRLNRQVNKR